MNTIETVPMECSQCNKYVFVPADIYEACKRNDSIEHIERNIGPLSYYTYLPDVIESHEMYFLCQKCIKRAEYADYMSSRQD